MKKLLWLDDIRDPSSIKNYDVTWVKNYDEFVNYLINNDLPYAISFDHDLGKGTEREANLSGIDKRKARQLKQQEKTGYDCAKWFVNYLMDNNLPCPIINVHSMNPVGKENILRLFQNYEKYNK